MAWLILILVVAVIGGMLWWGSRGPADGKDDGSWGKYTGGGGDNFRP